MTHRLEAYLRELRDIRASGAGVNEISYYHPLANLLNELGKPLKPKVRCILNLRNRGAGVPDGGLFTADQLRRTAADEWHEGQIPNRGVLEVKGTGVELVALAGSEQVARYLQRYGLILITICAISRLSDGMLGASPRCLSNFV